MSNSKQYVSEFISQQEILNWAGKKILISTPTGSGKTTFITNGLYPLAVSENERILIISNRTILREQIEERIRKDGLDPYHIQTITYQAIENSSIEYSNEQLDFNSWKYIVMDEVHRISSESWTRKTDIFYNYVMDEHSDKVLIGLSATPEAVSKFIRWDLVYCPTKNRYEYLDGLFFYRDENLIINLLKNLNPGEKVLFYVDSKETGIKYRNTFPDSAFIFKETKEDIRRNWFSDEHEKENIIRNRSFDSQILFATAVINNGISIEDEQVKYIVISNTDVRSEVIQQVGRIREQPGQKLLLYVKSFDGSHFNGKIQKLKKEIEAVRIRESFGSKEAYEQVHKRDEINTPAIFRTNEINYPYHRNNEFLLEEYENSKKDSGKGYLRMLGEYFGFVEQNTFEEEDVKEYRVLEKESAKDMLTVFLETYVNVPLYTKEDKQQFRNGFVKNLNFMNSEYRSKANPDSMNSIMGALELPFKIHEVRKSINNKDYRVWILLCPSNLA